MRWTLLLIVFGTAPALAEAAQCDAVPVLAADTQEALRGVEDIVIDRVAGVAYLSAYDRLTVENEIGGTVARTTQGGVYALPLAALRDGAPTRLIAAPLTRAFSAETDFHPHGIDLYVAPSGERSLFVINHRFIHADGEWSEASTVEIFDVRGRTLVHRMTVSHPFISTPNDLVANGSSSFFVTNDHGYGDGIERIVEDVFGRGLGSVVYVDLARPPAQQVQTLLSGIAFANGIALSPDRRFLYVASSRDKMMLTYEVLRPTLPPRKTSLDFGPDNLSWGHDGKLYIAGHPSLIRFGLYAKTSYWRWGVHSSPSEVIRLDPTAPDPVATIEPVFEDDGKRLSGASVAAAGDGFVLVGTVLADRIGLCRL